MARHNITPRERSLELLNEAITTGIRGRNREAIESAIEILEDDGKGGLTDLHYKKLPVGQTLRDPNKRGLWLRKNKNGAIWLHNYTSPITGETKPHKIGGYPKTSLSVAREIYQANRDILAEGRDPFIESAEAASSVTVKKLCELFIKNYAIGPDRDNPKKRSWREDERMFNYDLIRCRGEEEGGWGDRPAASITEDDAEDLLDGIIEDGSPRSAEKLQTAARKMWNEAIRLNRKKGEKARKKRWVPGLKSNPWVSVELEKRETETTHLNEAQIRSFLRNLQKTDMQEVYRDALLLQFMTVARVGEVAGLTWDEIDFDNKIWNLPKSRSKNKQGHRVLLSKQAITLLERRKKDSESEEEDSKSDFVFPAPRSSGHLAPTLVARHLRRSREVLKSPDGFSTHGLRHSGLTQIAIMKYGKHIRDRISNHKDSSVDSIYQHYEYDTEARECWQAWADRLDAFKADNVSVLKHKNGAA